MNMNLLLTFKMQIMPCESMGTTVCPILYRYDTYVGSTSWLPTRNHWWPLIQSFSRNSKCNIYVNTEFCWQAEVSQTNDLDQVKNIAVRQKLEQSTADLEVKWPHWLFYKWHSDLTRYLFWSEWRLHCDCQQQINSGLVQKCKVILHFKIYLEFWHF